MVWTAALVWLAHGLVLARNRGRFRPHIALVHGLLLAVVGAGLRLLGLSALWSLAAGLAAGAVGALGHPLAPGVFVGFGLQWLWPLLPRVPMAGPAFFLGATGGVALTALVRWALPAGWRRPRRAGR